MTRREFADDYSQRFPQYNSTAGHAHISSTRIELTKPARLGIVDLVNGLTEDLQEKLPDSITNMSGIEIIGKIFSRLFFTDNLYILPL